MVCPSSKPWPDNMSVSRKTLPLYIILCLSTSNARNSCIIFFKDRTVSFIDILSEKELPSIDFMLMLTASILCVILTENRNTLRI